jgi:hypothetical protein
MESSASVQSLWQRVVPDFGAAFMAVERVEKQLREFAAALDAAGVPYAVIGGNAVAAWVATVDADATRTTKDVDVLVRRSDMGRIAAAVRAIGLVPNEVFGVPMFVEAENPSPRRAVHVIYADEPVRPNDARPAPSVTAARRSPQGFMVIDLPELVRMKLDVFRRRDQVHLEDLLTLGLIDAALAERLPDDLLQRLREIRDTMEWFTPPPQF